MSSLLPSILVFSDDEDGHLPFVLNYLPEGMVTVLSPQSIIRGHELTYTPRNGRVEVTFKQRKLRNIKSVWYRKPRLPKKEDLPVKGVYADYCFDALKKHFCWLLDQFEEAFWISEYYALQCASNKMTQPTLAQQLGFKTPDTILTSHSKTAETFLKKHPFTIIKPISIYGFPFIKEEKEYPGHFFATKKSRGEKVDFTNLELAPTIFQEAVEDILMDIRVTVVGSRVFAASITNPGLDETKTRDWRIGHYTETIKIEPFTDLPSDIVQCCIEHVRKLNLCFGALDLVLDKKGNFWFLENNPNGQWAFVEEATSQPIGREIAHMLRYQENTHD